MSRDSKQTRKYQLTINNPDDIGLTTKDIKAKVDDLRADYCCLSMEVASTGTPHIHIFIYRKSAIRFETVKKMFPTAHIETAKGSCQQNKDYIQKIGKWAASDKAETTVEGTFAEWGTMPDDGKAKKINIINEFKEGKSIMDILETQPEFALRTRNLNELKMEVAIDKFSTILRDVKVIYLYGIPTNKIISLIYTWHQNQKICRITNYRKGKDMSFDTYHFEDVIVFDDYDGLIPLNEFSRYISGFPLYLPARFNDKIACYNTVYIVSCKSLDKQYPNYQNSPIWSEFINQIDTICCFNDDGEVIVEKGELTYAK